MQLHAQVHTACISNTIKHTAVHASCMHGYTLLVYDFIENNCCACQLHAWVHTANTKHV
jgi:hypothetical protein